MTLAVTTWRTALSADPGKAAVAVVLLVALTIGVAFAVRALNQRVRSLRQQVLVITLAALVVGAAAAFGLSWLMVFDAAELGTVLGVLGITAGFAIGLTLVASAPLGRDVGRIEETVRRIERGDRDVRTPVARNDELGHVARALDQLTHRLDTLERERATYEDERAAMLTSVGHDLRTPLAALRAAVEALADGVAPDPARYLRSMQRDIDALTALVDDLFLLVRIEHGRFDLQPTLVDLTEVADEAVEALAPVAAERGVDLAFTADGRIKVEGNATALGRVIRNLIDNAIRHAPTGSTVRVAVQSDGTVRVIDDGPGFPDDFTDQAFDRFTRADASRNRDTGGAGLGLAIARSVVEAHGGRIWIEPTEGGHVAFELQPA
jgi:signal transduction histidine kinase